jgi:hypothetical protein
MTLLTWRRVTRRSDIWVTSSRSSDLGTPSLLMASIRAATFSMEARVSARRSCGERYLVSETVDGGLAGASTSMASAVGAAAIGSAGAWRDDASGLKWDCGKSGSDSGCGLVALGSLTRVQNGGDRPAKIFGPLLQDSSWTRTCKRYNQKLARKGEYVGPQDSLCR